MTRNEKVVAAREAAAERKERLADLKESWGYWRAADKLRQKAVYDRQMADNARDVLKQNSDN